MADRKPKSLEADRWAGEMGDKWDRYIDQFEPGIRAVGEAAVAAAELRPGESVLDIGCGGGLTTQWIAERVGPDGTAIGVDVSAPLIETARRRAGEAGIRNIDFVCADAARIELDAPVDCLFSRFGVMFFDEPYVAFGHLRGLLVPGGRVLMACWGPMDENPWVAELLPVPQRYVDMPPADPHRPGPMAFADTAYVTDILTAAHFSDIGFTPWRGDQLVGGDGATAETAARFLMNTLFIGDLLKDEPDAVKANAIRDLEAILRPYESADGVRMGAMAWLISARAS